MHLLQSGLRFGRNLTQRQRGCCRAVVAFVEMLDANPDGQRKDDQQDRKGNLEHSQIGRVEYAGHIEVEGHEQPAPA